ncbi:MAG: sigma-54-dependent Fis family transcriptional regulator [Deltaproteobacteria bacterium]|nr:sigma-54-dependent Fis family transcriptional regulator [Deltaproteobacteria bacterium]
MSQRLLEAETMDRGLAAVTGDATRLITLTLVHHPDAQRVGDRVRLPLLAHARARVPIGRAEPLFRASALAAPAPLLSPFVSRKPLWLEGLGDGAVRIDATEAGSRVEVDGAPLTRTLDVAAGALERGVVVQIGGHVVLLLHDEAQVERPRPSPLVDELIIGGSDRIERVRAAIERAASDTANVLVRGETGSGKELVAQAIHRASARRDRPFVAVNMAAVAPTLAGSTLFGHVRGAFSGADQSHDGLFVRAHGGTLVLDEVGDTPPEVQAALLRVLETGEVMPVGGRAARAVDVRVVAATDADLDHDMAQRRFRAPLFYRLATSEVSVPPLRERRADIGRLVVHFLAKELAALGREALLRPALTDESPWLQASLVARLALYDWPGNVRQLRSVCHALALASESPSGLPLDELARLMPASSAPRPPSQDAARTPDGPTPAAPAGGGRTPASITPDELERALVAADYRLSVAADHFGISRPSMNELVDRHPRLKRAQKLTDEDVRAGQREAARTGDPLWRVLQVSERGLKQRMKELGLE